MANFKDPQLQKRIKGFCQEMSDSMLRISAERDLQKEAIAALVEEFDLTKEEKKIVKKMSTVFYRSNFHTMKTDNEQFEIAYETLFGDKDAT